MTSEFWKGNLHHLMSTTGLFLIWPVGHMEPHITDWAIYQIKWDILTYWAICSSLSDRW